MKLLNNWVGAISEFRSDKKKIKLSHAYLMKAYKECPDNMVATIVIEDDATSVPCAEYCTTTGLTDVETVDDVILNPELSDSDTRWLMSMIKETHDVFTERPGKTCLCSHTTGS